jgi:ketosteroid isomerase-like protein
VSPEHLETIHRLYDAMNRRDLAAIRKLGQVHPDFSWEASSDELDAPGRLDSRRSLAYSKELFEIFDEVRTDIEETIDLGAEQVIFVVTHHVRGAASGARVARHEVHLWTVRDGRVASLREYPTVDDARAAAV